MICFTPTVKRCGLKLSFNGLAPIIIMMSKAKPWQFSFILSFRLRPTRLAPGSKTEHQARDGARERQLWLALCVSSVLYLKDGQGVLNESVYSIWQMEC